MSHRFRARQTGNEGKHFGSKGQGQRGGSIKNPQGKFRLVGLAAAVLGFAAVAGCGGSSSGGSVTLNWFIANQPGGSIQEIAKRCTDESNGRYKVDVQLLPSDATQQREQLVRRLAAKDSTIDIVGMDVVWTAEFANAGWISQFPAALAKQVTQNVFPNVVKTASFEGKLYGAPFNSNTQLLWYRKDLVPKRADDLEPDDRRGREAGVRGKAGHDPGAGQQVRGLHGVGQRADRSRRARRSSPARRPSPWSRSRRRRRSR